MRSISLKFLFPLLTLAFSAQSQINKEFSTHIIFTPYGLQHSGRHSGVYVELDKRNWTYSMGFDIAFVRHRPFDYNSNAYVYNGAAQNLLERFMPKLGIKYYNGLLKSDTRFFTYGEVYFSKQSHHNNFLDYVNVGEDTLIEEKSLQSPSYINLMWNYGLGAESKLTDKASLIIRAGIGTSLYLNNQFMIDGLAFSSSVSLKYRLSSYTTSHELTEERHYPYDKTHRHAINLTLLGESSIGKTSALDYSYALSKSLNITAGIRFLYKRYGLLPFRDGFIFKNRFKASEPHQQFGVGAGLEYRLPVRSNYLELFLFDDISYFNSDFKANKIEATGLNAEYFGKSYETYYIKRMDYHNLRSVENRIGIGFNSHVIGNLFFTARAGLGINFISNIPQSEIKSGRHTEASFMYSAGLKYKFGK